MNRYLVSAFGTLGLLTGPAAPLNAAPAALLAKPEAAQANIAASPKLDERVFVYSAEAISGSVSEHTAGSREVALNVGARDGVRFGHAFQIVAQSSRESIGVAKVIELQGRRCVAQVVYLDKDQAAQSLKGFAAVCAAPKANKRGVVVQCVFGKDVWQTESLENKLIRGLLESGGGQIRLLIREDDSTPARGE